MTVPGSALRFEILGPLRAWREGTELDLGPGKQRAVLAVLLLNANRPTPTARIVDAVWGQLPPENGVNVVQKYVAGLRRILEPGRSPRTPGTLLTWTEAGYTLHVPRGGLDTDAFDEHVVLARTARSMGRTADAAGHLQAALGLWRDQALAGLRGAFFDSAREQLAEDRAAAFEESAQIEIDLGHHERLVPELSRLVAEFPLREQLRYLLILSLYRGGRQAEALAAYQDARRFLAEEFGVEPGERLQQLHLSILRSDRTLVAPDAPPAPPVLSVAPPAPLIAPVAEVRRRPWPLRLLAVSVPLISFGVVSWAVIAFFAARRRSLWLGVAAGGYFLLVVVFGLTTTDDPDSRWEAVAILALLLAMAGGAVHTALLVSGPRRHGARPNYDTLRSLELRIRREQALTLLAHHPHIARELRIGRPDLSRVFNDGGLVDINAVPEHTLAALPGVTVFQAQQIVARRQAAGNFTSVEDLVTAGLLPLPTVRALSDVLIVVDGETPPPLPAPERMGELRS
ncbi:MAG TPA: BTAD domain-containing putative transcriptional regulator [Actinoallomurus sp.]|nr:BTAD domain-containing putative transcriptional regulator [Actinoallomurus sp.]